MIEIKYEFKNKVGSLKLHKITDFSNKEEVLDSLGSSSLEEAIFEEVLSILDPDVDTIQPMHCNDRGAKRESLTLPSEAERLGFSKLVATIDGNEIFILI
ncbi:hypothetical protein I6F10_05050 [Pseudoalteromonas sp. SWYJZ98]|uniref:hypothetical protein n=1 Tax=unclassified Pseudoalteromonas TaxID=194690 RepID=UPI00110BB478|nr:MULTISPECIES: hypothetical protein [unclassified Pseudoalteromonas]MBH0030280.1 hypothetical protein [Pseudoalteromonas sp. SWYJZ98]TMP17020.1 hypothetical protein CWC04_09915 [Pseudoalteromonas sp. S2893]